MSIKRNILAATALCAVTATASLADTITVATVNNDDMIKMQGLTSDFEARTGHKVEWVTLEENVLRQRVTTDITTKGGAFDVMMIGMYETPIWGKNGWLVALDDMPEHYAVEDILPAVRGGLSYDGTLYAAPFYAESSMVHYRTDLMEKAGLEMPAEPTWAFIREAAAAMTDRSNDINGICMRGKAGWGEGGAIATVLGNSFGARWFDEDWNAQFDSAQWKEALTFYTEMMAESGPSGYATNGFNENLSLFRQGKCGMWMDATVAAGWLAEDGKGGASDVAGNIGWAVAPNTGKGKNAGWLWAWALAIPAGSQKVDAAKEFMAWATGPDYMRLVAFENGHASIPPGTRQSLYDN
ncbi:MAG: sugar ABC transporter substrate-binding protein, partial [Paracoccaceae bacterium]